LPNLINNQLPPVLSDRFCRPLIPGIDLPDFVGLKPKGKRGAAYRWLKPTVIEPGAKRIQLPSALADGYRSLL